jgi:hypothetical protein
MTESLRQPVKFARSGKIAPNVFLKVRCALALFSMTIWRVDRCCALQSAMTERLCTWDDANPNECGKPTPEYLHLYEEWGQGQIGCAALPS